MNFSFFFGSMFPQNPHQVLQDVKHTPNTLRAYLGGKGAGLLEMSALGLPIPPGFVLARQTLLALSQVFGSKKEVQEVQTSDQAMLDLGAYVHEGLKALEDSTGRILGHEEHPLFLSVRSSGVHSMPGMMDTFLNVGLSPKTLPALEKRLGISAEQGKHLWQGHQSHVCACLKSHQVRHLFLSWWSRVYSQDAALDPSRSPALDMNLDTHFDILSHWVMDTPLAQLFLTIAAVAHSWNNQRSQAYRQQLTLTPQEGQDTENPENLEGSAVIIQAMVFGNAMGASGTGVMFTRDPVSGHDHPFGEYLPHCQGEALVSGDITPQSLQDFFTHHPQQGAALLAIRTRLEYHYKDMQDVEFTLENGVLWILQTRCGKRAPLAELKIALDLVDQGLRRPQALLDGISFSCIQNVMHGRMPQDHTLVALGRGLSVGPGVVSGPLIFVKEDVSPECIFVSSKTGPEDVPAMLLAKGVITLQGGLTSHAAVILRGAGKVCITSFQKNQELSDQVRAPMFSPGAHVTLDGNTGNVFSGYTPIEPVNFSLCASSFSQMCPEHEPHATGAREIGRLLRLAKAHSPIEVMVNGDTANDITLGLDLGATGVALVRSEHMMLQQPCLSLMQRWILRDSQSPQALEDMRALEALHSADIAALIAACQGRPMTFRLLDPPLHEFLPSCPSAIKSLANAMGQCSDSVSHAISTWREVNPMMGHRGLRLAMTRRDIYAMQVRAIIGAITSQSRPFDQVKILIPFAVDVAEIRAIRESIPELDSFRVGVMIETPRAALLGTSFLPQVDFFSIGTNDLTQMTWALSRDDYGKFFPYPTLTTLQDPFCHFDVQGVGKLLNHFCQEIYAQKPDFPISVCGEHAGCPDAITFFHTLGIKRVSCSPWRIPQALLAGGKLASAPRYF